MKIGLDHLHKRFLYQDYKRRLDVRAILDHYGAQNCREMRGADGTTEILHSCILDHVEPHHRNGDANPSAVFNVEKKLFCCYNYWSGSAFHLIQKMEGKEALRDIVPVVGEFLTGATQSDEKFSAEINSLLMNPSAYSVELPEYSERVLAPWLMLHPYMKERGISVEAGARLKIGYDESENRIVFPHFANGVLVGWQKRAIPERPGEWPGTVPPVPKYRNSSGFPKSETLYNLPPGKGRSCVVVESPMSVARAVSLQLPIPVVATFGAKVSQAQCQLLAKHFSEVIVWMDADPAGLSAEKKLVQSLYRHTTVHVVRPEKDKDLADYSSLDEVNAMIENASPAALLLFEWEEKRHGREGVYPRIAKRRKGACPPTYS